MCVCVCVCVCVIAEIKTVCFYVISGKRSLEKLKYWSFSLIQHLLNPAICKTLMIKDGEKKNTPKDLNLNDEESHRGASKALW